MKLIVAVNMKKNAKAIFDVIESDISWVEKARDIAKEMVKKLKSSLEWGVSIAN
jgi:electron transfer flavoprotein alpha subunit